MPALRAPCARRQDGAHRRGLLSLQARPVRTLRRTAERGSVEPESQRQARRQATSLPAVHWGVGHGEHAGLLGLRRVAHQEVDVAMAQQIEERPERGSPLPVVFRDSYGAQGLIRMTSQRTKIRQMAYETGLSNRKAKAFLRMRRHCQHTLVESTDPMKKFCNTCGAFIPVKKSSLPSCKDEVKT